MMSKHYCGGELKSVALFAEAEPCHQNKQMKSCPLHGAMPEDGTATASSKGCCDTVTDFLKVEDEQVEASLSFDLLDYPALVAVLAVVVGWEPTVEDDKTLQYFTYQPPLLVYDLPVSLQTFLC